MCEVETITKIAGSLGVSAGDVKLNSEKVSSSSKYIFANYNFILGSNSHKQQ